jgi:hypothetical protein
MKKRIPFLVIFLVLIIYSCDWLSPPDVENKPDIFMKAVRVNNREGVHYDPAVAQAEDELGIAWQEYEGTDDHINFAIINPDGSIKVQKDNITDTSAAKYPALVSVMLSF